MAFKLFLILLPLLITSQGFSNSGNGSRNTGSDQNLINCLSESKAFESIIFRTLNSLTSGKNISSFFQILSNYWGFLSSFYTICEGVLTPPEEKEKMKFDFPVVDWKLELIDEVFYINDIDYAQSEILENPDYENCMYAVDGLAMRIYEIKLAIESDEKERVANILYSFKDIKDALKNECP